MDHLEELSDTELLDLRDNLSEQRRTLLKDRNDHMRQDLEEEATHKFAKRLTRTHFEHIDRCKNGIFDIHDRMKDCLSRRGRNTDMAMKCISELRHVQDDVWRYAQCIKRLLLTDAADYRGDYGTPPPKRQEQLRSCLSMAGSSYHYPRRTLVSSIG